MKSVIICFKTLQEHITLLSHQNERFKDLYSQLQSLLKLQSFHSGVDILAIAANEGKVHHDFDRIYTVHEIRKFVGKLHSYVVTVAVPLRTRPKFTGTHRNCWYICEISWTVWLFYEMRKMPRAPVIFHLSLHPVLRVSKIANFKSLCRSSAVVYYKKWRRNRSRCLTKKLFNFESFQKSQYMRITPFVLSSHALMKADKSYRNLRGVCGGLDTGFPATAAVESDILPVNYEGSAKRQMLSKVSSPGIMQA